METPEELDGSPENAADDGELRLGSSERGAAANGVILALTRAARSFLLYDPSNEAIRHFLGALRETVEAYLQAWGELPLVVRPFELVVHGEVVYLDRDRERSLAFRLFRDGVRKVTLAPELTWQELLKLLEILSIRYTGVRQTEDDMVVLLWKAGFANIQLEAVEGFVPEEEVGDAGAVYTGQTGHQADVPPDFDLPPPAFHELGPLRYRALAPAELEPFVLEDSNQALPELCVRLCSELLRAAGDVTDPLSFEEVIPQLREIRDFLLAEGLLDSVLAMARMLAEEPLRGNAAHERDALLESFGDERAVSRILHSVPRDATTAPPEMLELLDQLAGNHLPVIVSSLATERGEASRRVARSLIERYVPRHAGWIVDQIATIDAGIAVELLRALAAADLNRASEAVLALMGRPELELQLEALKVAEAAPMTPNLHRFVAGALAASSEEVRIRAMELVARRDLKMMFTPLAERVKREAPLRLGQREATAAGEALAHADPLRALELFRDWIKPRKLFGAILPGQSTLQWVAVSGLALLPGDEPEALIKHASERAGSELARHCTACMVKRRRLQRGAL